MMIEKILPKMGRYPYPNSILILDNAKIHLYPELENAVHDIGALLFYLPPYSPQFNPIETGFSILKSRIKKDCNIAFGLNPGKIVDILLKDLFKNVDGGARNIYSKSGYGKNGLDSFFFEREIIRCSQ